jgi:uncharacterized protein YbjT (DUF2867 family)
MRILITGGSGYIGTRVGKLLAARDHSVRALVRAESAARLPSGVQPVMGNALDPESVAAALASGETLVHLVGTPHPNPYKAAEFERVDLASVRASVAAAKRKAVAHLVYVSVAHPAPAMHAYVSARVAGEAAIVDAGLTATILRPWYVLGPGHWWPAMLLPVYGVGELLPWTRAATRRLGLVTLVEMARALVLAVESRPPSGTQRIVEVPEIRRARLE